MLNVVRHQKGQSQLEYLGHQLLVAQNSGDLALDLGTYLAVIIENGQSQLTMDWLTQLRKRSGRDGLIPVFLLGPAADNRFVTAHFDGCYQFDQLDQVVSSALPIAKRLMQIPTEFWANPNQSLTEKMLAYLYSRQGLASPIKSRKSNIGYYYPAFQLWYGNRSSELILDLEAAKEQGLLDKSFADHIHLCGSCHGNYLNFQETCPSCHSNDITINDMIHHFVCAHVAPEADFIKDDHLECPKCNKTLRHIGIDYDKPSSIFTCNSCSNEFQNPRMQALCFDCEQVSPLTKLKQVTIGNYSLTAKGESRLLEYTTTTKVDLGNSADQQEQGVPIYLFRMLLNQELKRIKNYQSTGTFAKIELDPALFQGQNARMKQRITTEIQQVIQSYLLDADVISQHLEGQLFLLLPNTRLAQAQRLECIENNLCMLLGDNLTPKKQAINIQAIDLKETDDLEELMNR